MLQLPHDRKSTCHQTVISTPAGTAHMSCCPLNAADGTKSPHDHENREGLGATEIPDSVSPGLGRPGSGANSLARRETDTDRFVRMADNFVMLWCMPMTEPSWRRYASQNHSTSSLIEPLPRPATFSDTNSIISHGAGARHHTSTGGVPGCQAGRGAVTVCVHTQPIDQPGGLYDQALCCTLSTGARRRADRAQARWSPSGPSRATYATQIHSNRYKMRTFFTGTPIANTSYVMINTSI